MYIFSSTREIINTLSQANSLIENMFEKRNALAFRYEYALEFVDDNRLQMLLEREILRQNGPYIELDERFLEFFEYLLEANEDISTASIDENIQQLQQHINYYLDEDNTSRKNAYLRRIKSLLRKIGKITFRNSARLQDAINSTFKNEPNYKIKIAKLENLDSKRSDIKQLIDITENLLTNKEQIFFRIALDEELEQIVIELRRELLDASHSLIHSQQDIINYLNQIKTQIVLVEKIRRVKQLKDQFELLGKSNLKELLGANHSIPLEKKIISTFRLSISFLGTDGAREVILKANRFNLSRKKMKRSIAGVIDEKELEEKVSNETFINLDEIKNGFLASGNHLFNFVLQYAFQREVNLTERVTIYCQLVSLYGNKFDVREEFGNYENIEYAIIYPK